MPALISVVTDYTPKVLTVRRSDGFLWNVSGSNINTYTNLPAFADAKSDPAITGTGLKVGYYSFSITGLSDGWHDFLVYDNNVQTVPQTIVEGYVKSGEVVVYAAPLYHAEIRFTKDGTTNEYTVTWFKDGARIASGITSPVLNVHKRTDGTKLINGATLTEIGTGGTATGSYKYDEATNVQTAGEAYLVIASATIDSATRTFSRLLGRDS